MKRILTILLVGLALMLVPFMGISQNSEVKPETALRSYLDNEDNAYKWHIHEKKKFENVTEYTLFLTSQVWRGHTWVHQLSVYVPEEVTQDGALLFIMGGSVKDGKPNWRQDDKSSGIAGIAEKNKAVTAALYHTPNQPLYGGLGEDQLISYTLHNWRKDKDYTWPLLFPMVKGAVKAMDAIQEFTNNELKKEINRFLVTGGSKRGWTTWLTGSQDKRVEAIAPMVIDVLNMPVSLDYHVKAWNEYSIQIEDYTKLEIPQQVRTSDGDAITAMVDPYSYRDVLAMPKMIFIGTNDEYWPVDAIKHYIDDIPGQNSIHYVPNAGHDLGGGKQALIALNAFFGNMLNSKDYNMFGYELQESEKNAEFVFGLAKDKFAGARIWSATSDDRDFRDEKWTSEDIVTTDGKVAPVVDFPEKGFKAFYIDLEYKSPTGENYTKSTRMFVVNQEGIL